MKMNKRFKMYITTGFQLFAECPEHSLKARKQTTKSSPSANCVGRGSTGNGFFVECFLLGANGDIEEELYMVQAKGFVDPKDADKVCKL
jgi:hypothetical protein